MPVQSKLEKGGESLNKTNHNPLFIKYPFWFGGSGSSLAACVTHPLDLVKVRLQTRSANSPNTMIGTFKHVVRNDGILGLYSGLSASLLRQMTYSTMRFGVYEKLKDNFEAKHSHKPSGLNLVWMGSVAGFLGGLAGNPADVINIRMQHDASLPKEKRRMYKNALDGLIRVSREEGAKNLFRGVWPNCLRAILMTASQTASYDVVKGQLMEKTSLGDGAVTHFIGSAVAAVVATTVCSPADVIKTRIMSSSEKKGLFKLLADIIQAEGVTWVFRGWFPSFIRLGPQTIATWMFVEQHRKIYRKLKGIDEQMENI